MIEIEVKADREPDALAQLIASAVHGQPAEDPGVTLAGKQIRDEQEQAEVARGSWTDMATVNFATIDDENDWSDI